MGIDKVLTKVFGSSNQRYLKTIQPLVEEINALEPSIKKLSDEELRARTAVFKEQLQQAVAGAGGKEKRKPLQKGAPEEILPEAVSLVPEDSVCATGMPPSRV